MPITCFVCIIHLEMKKNYSVAILPHMQVNFQNPGKIDLVNQNYSLSEPFATIVDNAFLRLRSDIYDIMNHKANKKMMK